MTAVGASILSKQSSVPARGIQPRPLPKDSRFRFIQDQPLARRLSQSVQPLPRINEPVLFRNSRVRSCGQATHAVLDTSSRFRCPAAGLCRLLQTVYGRRAGVDAQPSIPAGPSYGPVSSVRSHGRPLRRRGLPLSQPISAASEVGD